MKTVLKNLNLNLPMKEKNIYRVKLHKFPNPDQSNFTLNQKIEFKNFINDLNTHPWFVKYIFSTTDPNKVTVFLLNETTHKPIDNQLLLNKLPIPKTKNDIVQNGFSKEFDLTKQNDFLEFTTLIKSASPYYPDHGQPLPKLITPNYQSLDLISNFPPLFNTCLIQSSYVTVLTTDPTVDQKIKNGHTTLTVENGKLQNNHQLYSWTKKEHEKLAQNPLVSPSQQREHDSVVQKMEKLLEFHKKVS